MRLENLPDGGHDKVILSRERGRDSTIDKVLRQSNYETWWRRTTAMLLAVSFGSYRRRPRDVLIRRSGYVPLRRLGDVPLRGHWVFYLRLVWDAVETYWWDVVITSPWDIIATYQSDIVKTYTETSWRRYTETSLNPSFETYLRRHWDVQRDDVTTSPRRLVAGRAT